MSIRKSAILFGAALSMAAFMGGCSSSSKEGPVAFVNSVSEGSCTNCHAASVDHIAGTKIVDAYFASAHFTNNSHQVGCQDCHGGGAMHDGKGPIPYPNPDHSGVCFSCHKPYLPVAHYNAYTTNAGSRPAMYVAKNYQASCTSCHDPHKADKGITQEHRDWAESGHGDVNGVAWADRDFKTYDMTGACTPCHTSTGFINFVNGGFVMPTVTYAQPGDFSREVLTCAACHTSYDFGNKVRVIGAVTAVYTYNGAAITFPGSSASNLCIVCHSGRGNTQSAVSSRFQGHHAPAAAFLFNTKSHIGYEYTGPGITYTNNGVFAHDKVGTSAYPGTDDTGPCVACHMVGNAKTHSFAAVTKNVSGGITAINTSGMCANCHSLTGFTATLEARRLGYNNAGLLLNDYLNNVVKNYSGASGNKISYSASMQKDLYGAFQNAKITTEEKGGYIHNSLYVKRLIFDSIDLMTHGPGRMTGSITIPAGYPDTRLWFSADADGVAARP